MSALRTAFDWGTARYADWFGDLLHIHFAVRTVLLALLLWGALFVLAQLLHYIVGPLWVLFYRHVIFRGYNFLLVETLYEWLYIRYYSQDKPTLRKLYLRLCDKVKLNRAKIADAQYKAVLARGSVKRFAWELVVTAGIALTAWLTAFGLHQEYYVPALAGVEQEQPPPTPTPPPPENGEWLPGENGDTENDYSENGEVYNEETPAEPPPGEAIYPAGDFDPSVLGADAALRLNDYGAAGVRLRDRPGFGGVVLLMLWGEQGLVFLNEYEADTQMDGLYWLRVRTDDGMEGYIASHVIAAP